MDTRADEYRRRAIVAQHRARQASTPKRPSSRSPAIGLSLLSRRNGYRSTAISGRLRHKKGARSALICASLVSIEPFRNHVCSWHKADIPIVPIPCPLLGILPTISAAFDP